MPEKTQKPPQQKKRESYSNDRRNTYGENAKSSRKSIPRKKRRQNRAERRLCKQAFVAGADTDLERADLIETQVIRKRKSIHRLKVPDSTLAEVVAKKIQRRVATGAMAPQDAECKLQRVRRLTNR